MMPLCSDASCTKKAIAKGLCTKHYQRVRRKIVERIFECPVCLRTIVTINSKKKYCDTRCLSMSQTLEVRRRLISQGIVSTKPCAVPGCIAELTRRGKGFCGRHYAKLIRGGDPFAPDREYGQWTISDGYRVRTIKNGDGSQSRIMEHRLVMAEVLGRPLTARENIHHRNGRSEEHTSELQSPVHL